MGAKIVIFKHGWFYAINNFNNTFFFRWMLVLLKLTFVCFHIAFFFLRCTCTVIGYHACQQKAHFFHTICLFFRCSLVLKTNNESAAGVIPEIKPACAMVSGRYLINF